MKSILTKIATVAAALSVVGCAESGRTEVLFPEAIEVTWEPAYNATDDGLGAVVAFDVLAFDSTTGTPRSGIVFDFTASQAVFFAESLEVENSCQSCEVMWDANRDEFVSYEVLGESMVTATTDSEGALRLFLIVDSFPGADGFSESDGDFDTISVVVSQRSDDDNDTVAGTVVLEAR